MTRGLPANLLVDSRRDESFNILFHDTDALSDMTSSTDSTASVGFRWL